MSQPPFPLDPDQPSSSGLDAQSGDRLRQNTSGNGDHNIRVDGNVKDSAVVSGDHNITVVGGDYHAAPVVPRPATEQKLLNQVKAEVASRLQQSLHNAVFINLNKDSQPDQVVRLWDAEVKIGSAPTQTLPDDVTILQVFDRADIAGRLLILGKPGAGKTTTQLDLTNVLLERAKADIYQPIPILLNLSTWKDEKQPIRDWVIAELKLKYGVSLKLGRQWLGERKLLPLLDGLDEVAAERQESCILRVNEFLSSESSPLHVTVCSRLAEYETLTHRLQLHGAICLKELSDEQIQAYLSQANRPLLWQMLPHHPKLLKLVRSPLLLSIMLLTYPQDSDDQWQQLQGVGNPLQFLLDAYIERMLHRQLESQVYGKCKIPPNEKTREWLIWLASHAQIEFLIEDLQPSMLSKGQKSLYLAILGLSAGLFLGLGCGLNEPIGKLLVGLLSGLLVWWSGGSIKPLENLRWSWRNSLQAGSKFGLIGGLLVGMTLVRIGEQSNVLIRILMGGLLFGLCGCLLGGIAGEPVEQKLIPNQGIRRSAINAVTIGLPIGMISGLFFPLLFITLPLGLLDRTLSWLLWGLAVLMSLLGFGLVGGLLFGGLICFKHFILRVLLYQDRKIPWNYARFLNYCTERLFLQRVGGRYRFIHKYLQDHFAAMPFEKP